jgi:histidine triad (HIT) family protein
MSSDCIFCRIVAGQAPAFKVFEDDSTLAFLDINPISPGHTLVIPREHHTNMFDIPEQLLTRVGEAARRIALSYRQSLGMNDANFLHSAGRAARQDVFHFHLHIIPRYPDDGLHLGYRPRSGSRDFDTVLTRIRQVPV